MSQIRITKVYEGAPGTSKYNAKSIDCEVARDNGLLKHSAWLWDVKEGDTLQVPHKELEEVRKACEGLCEFVLEHPKYRNHQVGTDVYPFEVIEWKTERCIVVREMDITGFTGCYDGHCTGYKSNPENPLITLRERRNGGWNEAGEGLHCPYILSDEPYYFRDPSF
jgi:hypothetical protein